MTSGQGLPVASKVASFVAGARHRNHPPEIIDAAKKCLGDWLGVALGACEEPAARAVVAATASAGKGNAILVSGGTAPAPFAALVNGTTAHCLDFDDTHVGSLAHLSAPTWAATLAAAGGRPMSGNDLLAAFIAGFETGASLGGRGRGETVTEHGLHSTAIFGRFAATAAAAAVLDLSESQIIDAIGIAATQAGGLTASFGTMSKPFHAGKAAMDGVLAAQLAAASFTAAHDLLDRPKAFAEVLVQDRGMAIDANGLGDEWQIVHNTFKPYASCLMTHAAIDAAREVSARVDAGRIESATVDVHPLALQVAGKTTVESDLEGKFSLLYCIGLGLLGHHAAPSDFAANRRKDRKLRAVMSRIHVRANECLEKTAASISVRCTDGRELQTHVPLAHGNPGNPMTWDALEAKFMALAEPRLDRKASELFRNVRSFETLKELRTIGALLN
jgi:2-methylcitrate dehydratase PrpD